MRPYDKAPLSFSDQVALLRSRGLEIPDEAKALAYLNEISYYRLSAYFLPYQRVKDSFNAGVTFDQILDTYTFDRELRLLVFDCIERIEVAIRTQMIYQMALHHKDSHWQDKQHHFVKPYYNTIGRPVDPYNGLQSIISRAMTARKPEVFIHHYRNTYDVPRNPPAWMCLELLTIGELSNLYRGLNDKGDKKRIADFFGVHQKVFVSWLHTLTYVRNLCAHHSRLWNRDLAIEPTRLLTPIGPWIGPAFENNSRVFYFICVMKYLLGRANPSNHLGAKLEGLFKKYPNVPVQFMGIPSDETGNMLDWQSEPIWTAEKRP
jgi:abortive infection bacteriophage resistance protein